ncbi:MAG: hypothetical protein ACETWE_00255 [Candidatus Bathyarchaeia archaeon]
MPQYLVKPANQIVVEGNPRRLEFKVGANATPAKMLPGRLVIHDAVDGAVKEAGAKARNIIGFLDVSAGKLESDAYAVGDQVMVVVGACTAKLTLLANESVAPGDLLVAAADGKVAKQAVGAMGSQGMIVGQALETSNVAQDAEILVDFWKGAEPAAAA